MLKSQKTNRKQNEKMYFLLAVALILLSLFINIIGIKSDITGYVVEQVYNFGVPNEINDAILPTTTTSSILPVRLTEQVIATSTTSLLENKGFFIQASDSFSDNFNRANSSNLGTNWTKVLGDLQLFNNGLNSTIPGRNVALLNHSSFLGIHNSTQVVDCSISDTDGDFCGVVARYENESNYYLLGFSFNDAIGQLLNLTKVVNNVSTQLNISQGTSSPGGSFALSINGTNLSIYSLGVLRASITDTSLQNDTSFIGTYINQIGVSLTRRISDYNISSDTAATTTSTSSTSTSTLPHANLTLYLTNSSFTGLYQNITAFTNASINITSKDEYPADVNMTLFVTNYTGGIANFNYSKSFLQNLTNFWTNGSFLINITWEGNLTFFGNSTAFYVDVVATSTTSSSTSSSTTSTSTSSSSSSTTVASGGGTQGEGGGGTKIKPKPPLLEIKPPRIIPPIIEIKPKPPATIDLSFYERIKATKEEKTILKILSEKIKVDAYPTKVNNLRVFRFRNTLFIPIEDFIFIINLEKPSFDVKVVGNKNLVNKAIIKEIKKIANEEIKKIKEEYNKRIKQINEEELSLEKKLRKEIKDKILLKYKIDLLNKEKNKKLTEEKEKLNKKIRELLEEREQVVEELKKIEPVICPALEIKPKDWCKDGKIVPGKKDRNGCKLPDRCEKIQCKAERDCGIGKCLDGRSYDKYKCVDNKCELIHYTTDPCKGVITTTTSSTSSTTTSSSTSSTSIFGVTTTTTSTSSSSTTISGIGLQLIEGEISTYGAYVNETILYFTDIIVESDRTNITIEELGIEEYEESLLEKAPGKVDYEGIYNLILFLIIILILLGIQYKKKKLNILVLSLVLGYTILTLILLLYNLGKYFVFGNISGLVLIIYQIYLLVKPVSKKSILKDFYSSLKNRIKQKLRRYKDNLENLNEKILNILSFFKEKVYYKRVRKRLVYHLPAHYGKEKIKIDHKRNKNLVYTFYFILGLFFFNLSLYLGLTLERDVFIYGYLVPIFLILFIILFLTFLGLLMVLVFHFIYLVLKKILKIIFRMK